MRRQAVYLGLAMVPPDSRLATAVRTVVAAHRAGKDWQTARQEVIEVTKDTGWFQAPRDMAFTMLAWLYGQGDLCTKPRWPSPLARRISVDLRN
jgi:hypothetical protein